MFEDKAIFDLIAGAISVLYGPYCLIKSDLTGDYILLEVFFLYFTYLVSVAAGGRAGAYVAKFYGRL